MRKPAILCLLLVTLLALPAAGEVLIERGIDIWWTPADGSTRADFRIDPIPAGFFCADSRPFQGSILFGGAPVATSPEGILGGADTVVQRLDDVTFSGAGVATTRVQMAALSLVGLMPVETRCGSFEVKASLTGEQPTTRMEITYDGEQGGRYAAPLDLVVRLTFTPVGDNPAGILQLDRRIQLNPADNSTWTRSLPGRSPSGNLMVDTNGDSRPDTLLPGTSAGFAPGVVGPDGRGYIVCHDGEGHEHCFEYNCEQSCH